MAAFAPQRQVGDDLAGDRAEAEPVARESGRDHQALHALHERKPWRVRRSLREMSLLLSTPGMDTVVLERAGAVVAYACCGKGADFVGWWHEGGGDDEELALLMPSALALLGQEAALVLLPPYRSRLRELLGTAVLDRQELDGPMLLAPSGPLRGRFYVDGLDSI